jgi:hypothetical protein
VISIIIIICGFTAIGIILYMRSRKVVVGHTTSGEIINLFKDDIPPDELIYRGGDAHSVSSDSGSYTRQSLHAVSAVGDAIESPEDLVALYTAPAPSTSMGEVEEEYEDDDLFDVDGTTEVSDKGPNAYKKNADD